MTFGAGRPDQVNPALGALTLGKELTHAYRRPRPQSLKTSLKRAVLSLAQAGDTLSMPPRKKTKPDEAPTTTTSQQQPPPESQSQQPDSAEQKPATEASFPQTPRRQNTDRSVSQANRGSWYGNTGSWKAKAAPVAELAKDGLAMAERALPKNKESPKEDVPTSPAKLLSDKRRRSSKAAPSVASLSQINASPSRSNDSLAVSDPERPKTALSKQLDPPLPPNPVKSNGAPEPAKEAVEVPKIEEPATDAGKQVPPQARTSWYGWWSKPDTAATSISEASSKESIQARDTAKKIPLPATTPGEELQNPVQVVGNVEGQEEGTKSKEQADTASVNSTGQSKGWFASWSKAQNVRAEPSPVVEGTTEGRTESQPPPDTEAKETPKPEGDKAEANTKNGEQPQKSSSWAFWSKESQISHVGQDDNALHKSVGELAVADTPSQSRPEAAQFNEEQEALKEPAKAKRGRARGKDTDGKGSVSLPVTPVPATPLTTTPDHSPTRKPVETKKPKSPANQVLPAFLNTYKLAEQPSIWEKIRRVLVGSEPESPHLHLIREPPRFKKAIAIGVHGFFPAPFLQRIIGPPTGTSIKFASQAAQAISAWAKEHDFECEIEKIALEGQGFITDRVSTLWKLLINWVEHIREADFILFSAHSQGVPVAIMLIAKLLQFGCVKPTAKIGVCAMAGINLGPFAEVKTHAKLFGAWAAELFDFSDPNSKVSQMYMGALDEVLKAGVRITYIASIDDQLVSVESATFSNVYHAYIYRAVYVDGRVFAPDFITHLVGFTLKLRNLGLPDHGLIRELSPALAGNLYSGDGHSSIYHEDDVYMISVKHALETTSLPEPVAPIIRPFEGPTGATPAVGGTANPYYLPWAMRGLLEEDFVKKELKAEVDELLAQFDNWRPVTKGLKDVKFRLEAVKSKL